MKPADSGLRLVRRSQPATADKSQSKQLFAETPATSVLSKARSEPVPAPLRLIDAGETGPLETEHESTPPFTLSWSPLPAGLERDITALLQRPATPELSAHVAFQLKEQELRSVLATLTVADARMLHRRLTIPASDDPLPKAFSRLTRERRDRLIRFLTDAPRRAAIEKTRR